jgi:DNA-binding transcriptional ArsR family regulator
MQMEGDEEELDRTFAALADRTRRAILSRLSETGEASVNDLAAPFAISLQAISKHLKVLEAAGLISRSRDAQFRRCRLEPAQLDGAIDWMDQHRQMAEQRYDRLAEHLRQLQSRQLQSRGSRPDDTTGPAGVTAPAGTTTEEKQS